MDTKKKILIGVFGVIVLIVGIMFIAPLFAGSDKDKPAGPTAPTPSPSSSATPGTAPSSTTAPTPTTNLPDDTVSSAAPSVPEPTPTPPLGNIDNSEIASGLKPTDQMQEVINSNSENLYNDSDSQLATSYPSNLLPLYKVSGVGDSNDITTSNGNPGWTALYASEAPVEEVASFYTNLMSSSGDYVQGPSGSGTSITGNVDGCSISITITPNNPERTGLDAASNVNVFIEKAQ